MWLFHSDLLRNCLAALYLLAPLVANPVACFWPCKEVLEPYSSGCYILGKEAFSLTSFVASSLALQVWQRVPGVL